MKPLRFDATMKFISRRFSVAGLGMLTLSVILAILPLHNLFVDSPLHFQVHGPRFMYGGIETLVFAAAMAIACLFARSVLARAAAVCVIGLLYLRLQYVDLPLIAGLLYGEAILATGRLLTCGWRRGGRHDLEFMLHLLCGIGAYSVLIAALSVVHLAYPGVLYVTMLCLGSAAMLITRQPPYCYLAVRSGVSGGWIERLVFALLFMTVLVMMAKTHLINDFDSWWYGLRSNYVLEQGGSIFTDLGLNHFVFYYPKLYEALMLPLFTFPDTSYPESLNIVFYALILYVVHDMAVGMTGNRPLAASVTLLTGWVPVVIFTALLVKPDLLTALVLLIAARYLVRFISDGVLGDGVVGAAALAIALAGKLTAIPFGGLMFIAAMAALASFPGKAMLGKGRGLVGVCSMPQLAAFFLGVATFAVFTYRTYSATGLPYIAPDFLRRAFESLGFTTHFPYTDFIYKSIGGDWHFDWQSLGILCDALIRPSRLPHIVYSWIGNVFVLTALVAALGINHWRKTVEFSRPFLLLCVPLFLMMLMFIAFLGKQPGGAGEYYVFPIILFTASSAASLHFARPWLRDGAIAALLLATVSNGFVWFAATPQWSGSTAVYGTNLFRSTFASGPVADAELKGNGLSRIAQLLDQANAGGHCTALADGDEFTLFRLHCSIESTDSLSIVGSKYLGDTAALSNYISRARFDFVLIPDVPQATVLSKVFADYAKLPGAVRIDDDLYSALDLRNVKQPLPVLPPAKQPPSQQALSLMGYLPAMKASYPDAPVDPLRAPLGAADPHLRKYLGADAIVLRTGTVVEVDSDKIPFLCPGKLDFSLGLLPSDQLKNIEDAALTISWSDGQDKRTLGRTELKVNPHGFEQQEISIGKCGKQFTTITMHAYRDPNAKYAYILMTDPLLHK